MNKREIIIIIIAGLAAVYGLVDYFVLGRSSGDSNGDKIQAAAAGADAFAQAAQARLIALSAGNSLNMEYAIAKSEIPWSRDPFISYDTLLNDRDTLGSEKMADMVYSGFIRLGKTILGVINGMEYGVGELVADLGYKVHQITPAKVTLLTESNKQIILYLEED